MYTRAITLPLQSGKIDEAIRLFQDSIAPIFKKQKGFKGGYLVGDRNTGKAVSFSLWETEADATAMDTSGVYQQWVAMLANVLAEPPVREQYEVYLQF
jgi:heme-degrading monooxygenase HmoA